MIFYFSGTGNSKYIAGKIAKSLQDEMIEMSQDSITQKMRYKLRENEKIGFVFPVYWYNMPMIVEKFVSMFEIEGFDRNYVYAVVTYGNSAGNVLNALGKMLNSKGIALDGEFGITMIDNYVVAYDVPDKAKQAQILEHANQEYEEIIGSIANGIKDKKITKGLIALFSPILKPFYVNANHTKKFYATDDCVSCKQCEIECPCNVIKVEEKGPKWEGDCSFCLKCIHRCPKRAIQYGGQTIKRGRYYLDAFI